MVQTMLNASLQQLELQAERKLLAEQYRAKDRERAHIRGVYFSGPVTQSPAGNQIAFIQPRKLPRSGSSTNSLMRSSLVDSHGAAHGHSAGSLPAATRADPAAKPSSFHPRRAPTQPQSPSVAPEQRTLSRVWSARRIDATRVEGLPGSRAYHDVLRQTVARTPPAELVMHDNHPEIAAQAEARTKARLQQLYLQRQGSTASLVPALDDAPRPPSYRPVAPWAKWRGGFDD
jgi:hypothetical protein